MAISSPWAQLEQQANATQAPPPVFAPVDMPSQPPQMTAPAAPPVTRTPTVQENNIANDQGKLEKIRWQQANPWGTPENHPGNLGKVAHVFSNIGNIAGDIFAPDVMAHVPGTQMNRDVQEKQLTNRLNQENTENEQNLQREAMTAHENEETAAAPDKAASEEALQGAQTENLKNPALQHLETDQGIFAFNPHTKELTPLTYQGQPLNPAVKPTAAKGLEHVSVVGSNGKPMEANFHPDTGKYTDSAGKEIENPQPYEKPNQGGMVTMIVPDPNNPGGGIVERLGAGGKVAPGAQTAAGVNAVNTPTTTQRTAAGRAETVVAMAPQVLSEINSMGPQLGPVMGRWNDFMQGKTGMDNPQFAGLRADLLMMSSAVALAHAQGRLPENLREEFDRAINAPKQTPANLTATIQHMIPWLQQMQKQGEPNRGVQVGGAEPQRPANVPEGYKFNQNGPKGAGWYAPTAK